jgi:hypothetical protein
MEHPDEVVGCGTVIESPDHGPEFCLGPVFLSLPPDGGGPPIPNWDWSTAPEHHRRGGTTWGDYELVGTYDGAEFTLTRPATPLPDAPVVGAAYPPCTPCPEPAGGWRVLDPSRTSDDRLFRAIRRARHLRGFADVWLDQSINPAAARNTREDWDDLNDPEKLILNVAVTHDTAAAETELRRTWGGALCVSLARHTEAELEAVLERLGDTPGLLTAGTGHCRVNVEVVYDDGSLQEAFDREHGVGTVVVSSALRPYTG